MTKLEGPRQGKGFFSRYRVAELQRMTLESEPSIASELARLHFLTMWARYCAGMLFGFSEVVWANSLLKSTVSVGAKFRASMQELGTELQAHLDEQPSQELSALLSRAWLRLSRRERLKRTVIFKCHYPGVTDQLHYAANQHELSRVVIGIVLDYVTHEVASDGWTSHFAELSQRHEIHRWLRSSGAVYLPLEVAEANRILGSRAADSVTVVRETQSSDKANESPAARGIPSSVPLAVAYLFEHREEKLTVTGIADAVGVHRSTLYRDENFRAAWNVHQSNQVGRAPRPPKGFKNAETGELEAFE